MYILWFFCRYTNPAYVGKVHSRLLVYIVRVHIVPPNGLRILPWIDWQKFIFVRMYRSCVHHIIHVILFWMFISISAWVSVRCARFTFDDVGPNVVRKIGRLVRCNWEKPIFAFKQLKFKDTSLVLVSVSCLWWWCLLVDAIILEGRNKDVIFRRYPWLTILVWPPIHNQLSITH